MKNLLVLDLDETLVHATSKQLHYPECFRAYRYFVYKRPYVDDFLNFIKDYFQVAIWTASDKAYALRVLDQLLPQNYPLKFVKTREDCTLKFDFELQDYYQVKKLKKLKKKGYYLEKIFIVDDTPKKAEMNYGNYIKIFPYEGDQNDDELKLLMDYLPLLSEVENLRKIEKRNWRQIIEMKND